MKKEFIPYELAVKLVELGFNEKSFDVYSDPKFTGFKQTKKPTPKILYQQAFRFFREKYNLYSHIFSKEDNTFVWCVRWYVDGLQKDIPYESSKTYEEAELACLNKLINIIETI